MMTFAERVGGVLVAPRPTLRKLADGAARPGDVIVLLVGWLLAAYLPALAQAWPMARQIGVDAGLMQLLGTMQHLLPDVLAILMAGMLMSLFVPRDGRGKGVAADLASYAWVPYLTLQLGGSLVYSVLGHAPSATAARVVTGVALAWSIAVWALALDAARQPKPPAPDAPVHA